MMMRQLTVRLVCAVIAFIVVCGSAIGSPLFVIRVGDRTQANGDGPWPDGTIHEHGRSPQLLRLFRLLEEHPGDKVIFLRDAVAVGGTAFVIVDPVLVQKIWESFEPMLELAKQEGDATPRADELNRLISEYARSRAALSKLRPAGMTGQTFDALVDRSDDDKTSQMDLDSDFERDLLQLRAQKRALSAARDLLLKERREAMAGLFASGYMDKQNRLNDEFQMKSRTVLEEAITSGAAKPIDP